MVKFKHPSSRYTAEEYWKELMESFAPEEFSKAAARFLENRKFPKTISEQDYPLQLFGQAAEEKVVMGQMIAKGEGFEVYIDFKEAKKWKLEEVMERCRNMLKEVGFDLAKAKDHSDGPRVIKTMKR
ncbi:MAG: hypothetical protein FWC79_02360 [Oscillospiraceae bacterium]|nr:hypothetical protein [Oscillospiraceae bacterium]